MEGDQEFYLEFLKIVRLNFILNSSCLTATNNRSTKTNRSNLVADWLKTRNLTKKEPSESDRVDKLVAWKS